MTDLIRRDDAIEVCRQAGSWEALQEVKLLEIVRDWLPIDGAPKDGTRIHVINDRGQFIVEWDDQWNDGWWICVDGKHDDRPLRGDAPTHFRYLPEPPESVE